MAGEDEQNQAAEAAAKSTLGRKKATAQAAFTRQSSSVEKLLETATPMSVLRSACEELRRKFRRFEEACEDLSELYDEKDEKVSELSALLSDKLVIVTDIEGRIALLEEKQSKKESAKVEAEKKDISELINSFKASLAVPKPEVKKFNGDSKHYAQFIAYIEAHVEPVFSNAGQRLSILIDSCTGIAYEAISSLIQCKDHSKAYKEGKDILKDLFGSKVQVTRAVLGECTSGSSIKLNDVKGLKQLIVSLTKAEITLKENGSSEELVSTEKLVKIYQRLPRHLQNKWNEKVVAIQEKDKKPAFSDMRKLIETFVKSQDNEYAASSTSSNNVPPSKPFEKLRNSNPVYATSGDNSREQFNSKAVCIMCDGSHYLNQCDNFKALNVKERDQVIISNRLCRNCLHRGHIASKCGKSNLCKKCPKKHHDLLHDPNFQYQSQTNRSPSSSVNQSSDFTATQSAQSQAGISCVEVYVEGKNAMYKVKAIIDCKSTCNLCTKRLLGKLDLPTSMFKTDLNVATGKFTVQGKKVQEAKVYPTSMQDFVVAKDILAIDSIPLSNDAMFNPNDLSGFSHLQDVYVPQCGVDEVDLLIGSGVPKAFHQLEERKGQEDEIYAVRQTLGWNIVGPKYANSVVGSRSYSNSNSNSTFFVQNKHAHSANETILTRNDHSIQDDVQKAFNSDFEDGSLFSDVRGMSVDDVKAKELVDESVQLVDGQFCVGIPWKEDPQNLPSSKDVVVKRLMHLKKKMRVNNDFYQSYKQEMQKYIDKAYLELNDGSGSSLYHYIPHHPVWHPRKKTLRIVWDCALSLNDFIYEGPDLLNSLVDVLIRFRRFPYVVCSDIRKMYLSVKVPKSDRGALRILWWQDGNLDSDPVEYRATVHMYGAKSSGFVANYCVKKLAKCSDSDDVSNVIEKDFYVDDQISSFENLQDAKVVVQSVKNVLKKGGFELTKFVSNSEVLMSSIPQEDRADELDVMFQDSKYTHAVLGVRWEVNSDSLKFVTPEFKESESPSCRSLLSSVAKVYDPLGVVSPVVLPLRVILQQKCMSGWDHTDEDVIKAWEAFCEVMQLVVSLKVPRCFKPSSFSAVTHVSLHGFCDASEKGYAAVIYIRQVDSNGDVSVRFVLGKSKVAPKFKGHIPQATIPKLEMQAAALLSKQVSRVKSCLDMTVQDVVFWSDSLAVLSCIKSEGRRFPVYWANRLAVIHAKSKDDEWRYVPTSHNPADVGSRGVQGKKAERDLAFWVEGPSFLMQDVGEWPEKKESGVVQEVALSTVSKEVEVDVLRRIIRHYSSLPRLLRVVARILRFMKHPKFDERSALTCSDLESALMSLIKHEQKSIQLSSLKRLKPMQDEDGVIRVSSRLCKADHLSHDVKFPIILPKGSHLTRLIIDQEHKQSAHMGPMHVLNRLRQRFWIINGVKSVKKVISGCRKCREENAKPLDQQMSPLPEERVTPSHPFKFVGLDFFGPFMCKVGRRRFKRYGCIFVCLATRAIHLECVNSLESSAFLCALSRFIARRGVPEKVFSDNGTNFHGAQSELTEILAESQNEVSDEANKRGITWHFHPPHGSHHGGHYERMIRSVRRVLRGITNEQEMSEDNLATFLCECERILNDRPLSAVSENPNDELPITPNMILLLRGNSCKNLFDSSAETHKSYHKQAQYMSEIFWKRWMKEYVPLLQNRQKWLTERRNLKVGDLVFMTDEGMPKGHWPIARVTKAFSDQDGLVRKVMVKTKSGVKVRPITKLALLEAME